MSLTSNMFLPERCGKFLTLGLEPGMSLMLRLSLTNFVGVGGLISKEGSRYTGFKGLLGCVTRLL